MQLATRIVRVVAGVLRLRPTNRGLPPVITAPRDVPVFRKEVYLSIKGDQASADGEARETAEAALDALKEPE